MSRVTLWRWKSLCTAAGCEARQSDFDKVVRAWRSGGRRYHTLEHLEACLREFDAARQLAQFPSDVEFALWFHDAVYITWLKGNELRSAELAARTLSDCHLDAAAIGRICAGINATTHTTAALQGDPALIRDIDLTILGQERAVYDTFERNVRREYWWAPRRRFGLARSAVLRSFLQRPAIYHFDFFRERYEAMARENLKRAIRQLEGKAEQWSE